MGSRSVSSTPPNGVWPVQTPAASSTDRAAVVAPAATPVQEGDGIETASPSAPAAVLASGRAPAAPAVGGLVLNVSAERLVGPRDFVVDPSPEMAARVAQLFAGLGSF